MATTEARSLVLVSKENGYVIIPATTPLTRLNYFDGKFLRASDLKAEQDYLRQLVAQSNQAGGAGVAHGFDLTRGAGDAIDIGPGLAIDPKGRVLLLPQGVQINVQELIEKSHDLQKLFGKVPTAQRGDFEECVLPSTPDVVDSAPLRDLYVIVISPADALCGAEAVYGKLCEEACVTSTDRPYAVEGLIVRAVPLVLRTPLPSPKAVALTQTHLRSRVASAYFADEPRRVASLISKFGLEQETWCLGADAAAGVGVPIGVIARAGATTVFLDAWIVRRERIESPARRYWQWRMMMRPWDVFLAQVLQFQCQLHDLYRKTPKVPGEVEDPCSGAQAAIREAADTISEIREFYQSTAQRFTALKVNLDEAITFKGGLTRLTALNDKLVSVGQGLSALPGDRFLISGGIVELPSAGYLPVVPGAANTINQQVKRLMGEGVDLRFCVVRPDYVAHALEEAQHMERISLLQGLDDPEHKPEVDILVPNGEVLEQKLLSPGTGFEASVDLNTVLVSPRDAASKREAATISQTMNFRGAARAERVATGGGAFYLSAENQVRLFNAFVGAAPVTQVTPSKPVSTAAATEASQVTKNSAVSFLDRTALSDTARLSDSVRFSDSIRQGQPRSGLWLYLRCDSNIFTMSRGDSANFNSRAIVAGSSGKIPVLDVELNGVFQVTQPARTSGTAQKLAGHIENASLSFRGAAFNPTGAPTRISVDLDVIATLTAQSAIEIRLIKDALEFVLSADWGKEPLEVSADIIERFSLRQAGTVSDMTKDAATIRETAGKATTTTAAATSPPATTQAATAAATTTLASQSVTAVTLAHADLKENDNVLSDKDARHIQALAALELVAKALKDSTFADAKARLMFPAPPKPSDELLVRGTLDWVLFHRRRTKRCSAEICAPPVSPARQYQVYHLAIGSLDEREAVRQKLINGNLPEDALNKLPLVDFDGGLASLATDPQAWRADWANIQPGNFIVYSAIANRESAAADGDTLALTRLDRLVDAVAPVSNPHSQMLSELLNQVPSTVPASSVDGVIFLFTIKAADLRMTKTASPAEVVSGENITYTLTLTNAGPEAAQNVVVTDALPGTFVTARGLGAAATEWKKQEPKAGEPQTVLFSKASVASEATASFEIVMRETNFAGNGTKVVNTATVASSTTDPNMVDNSATVTTPVIPPARADLVIIKTVTPDVYPVGGGTLTYKLVVTNQGPGAAQDVEVRDVLPAAVGFESAAAANNWFLAEDGRTVRFKKNGPMNAGDTATHEIVVRVTATAIAPPPASITNTATVQSATSDHIPSNNSDDATATRAQPQNTDLRIRKSALKNSFNPGDQVGFELIVTNEGTISAHNVVVTDPIPDHMSFETAHTPPPGWTPNLPAPGVVEGAIKYTKSVMAPADIAVFQLTLQVEGDPPSITNRATVESSTPDSDPSNNSASVTITRGEQPNANVSISKTAKATTVTDGGLVAYTIKVTNGPTQARKVRVVDQLPGKGRFESARNLTDDWDINNPPVGAQGGEVVFSAEQMGANQTVSFEVIIKTAGVEAITNTAIVTAANDPEPSSSAVTVNVVRPEVSRTGLVVFSQVQTLGRVVLQGSQRTPVKFTNNVPEAAALNTALKGFPPGMSLGRFRRITFAGAHQALDAEVNQRVDAVANAVKLAGGTVLGTNAESLLSPADKVALSNAGANLTGIDEVIFLEMG